MSDSNEAFRAFLVQTQELIDSTLCVCEHRADKHMETSVGRTGPCTVRWYDHAGNEFCQCTTFRPTFYRDGEFTGKGG